MYSVAHMYSKCVYCGLHCTCKIIYKITVFEEDIYRHNYNELSFSSKTVKKCTFSLCDHFGSTKGPEPLGTRISQFR